MILLENEKIKASIHPMGAELRSLIKKDTSLEYMWNGDGTFWPRHSPVLFPIVGGLINDKFIYDGITYTLPKHGFARDMEFQVEYSSAESASLILESTEATLLSFPFKFLLRLIYTLSGTRIKLKYEVENTGSQSMYFSIGAHPAFNVPLTPDTTYEDYYLEFAVPETVQRQTLNGNLLQGSASYLQGQATLPLKQELFYKDAIIFKDLLSTTISIKNTKNDHGLHYDFMGMPYMGIWAAKDAPFVCIEPWCGIPDSENHNQKIEEKEGIVPLNKGEKWQVSWSIEIF